MNCNFIFGDEPSAGVVLAGMRERIHGLSHTDARARRMLASPHDMTIAKSDRGASRR